MTSQVDQYLEASPALDPEFVSLRSSVYDPQSTWLRVAGALFTRTGWKLGPLPVRALGSAFGWEIRPWIEAGHSFDALIDELARRPDWDAVQLNGLSQEEAEELGRKLSARGHAHTTHEFPCRVIAGHKSWQDYVVSRGENLNRNQKRYRAKCEKAGYVFKLGELRWSDVERVLDSRRGEFENGGADYTRTPEFRRFFRSFLVSMAGQGRLLTSAVYAGPGEAAPLIAFSVGFWSGTVLHAYQTAYDPAFAKLSPGAVCLEQLFQGAIERGATMIDFMGEQTYLSAWSKTVLPLKRVVVYSRGTRGRLVGLVARLRG